MIKEIEFVKKPVKRKRQLGDTIEHTPYYKRLSDLLVYSYDYQKIKTTIQLAKDKLMKKDFKNKPRQVLMYYAFICTLFLTGGRISEIKNMYIYKDQIFVKDDFVYFTLRTLKKRKELDPVRILPIHRNIERWALLPIIKWYNYRVKEFKFLMEKFGPDYFVKHPKERYLFPLSHVIYYKTVIYATGMNPHAFRKIRATILINIYKWNSVEVTKFMGWANFNSGKPYFSISTVNMENDIQENKVKLLKKMKIESR